jgi:hypothetical protein
MTLVIDVMRKAIALLPFALAALIAGGSLFAAEQIAFTPKRIFGGDGNDADVIRSSSIPS